MRVRFISSSVALAALLLGVISTPASAAQTPPAPTNSFSCTASALRVNLAPLLFLPGTKIEPIVANKADKPCVDDSKGLVGPITFSVVTVGGVLTARTDATPSGGHAESAVTRVGIALAGGIGAEVLTSSTDVSCKDGRPSFSSSGEVVAVRIGGLLVAVPANQGPVVLHIPLVGTLYLNEVVTTPTSITRRALRLDTLLVDVVIAESKSNVEGSPCGATPPPPPPQCSDKMDNDGDELIDADDPGCLSGPGGSYDPSDDDETDKPAPAPQCNDGADNDGDKAIDASDPQCHTDGNPKNDKSYDPDDDDEAK